MVIVGENVWKIKLELYMSLNCNLKVKRDLLKNDMNYISE